MMSRQEALAKLRAEEWRAVPGLDFEVGRMEPRDAWGAARCFYSIYGAAYPIDTYYIPERLIEANACGDVYTVVARASNGDIVGQAAIYRSSCPNRRVFEVGQWMVLPEYREAFAASEIMEFLLHQGIRDVCPVAVFGEAVCHHLMTQKRSVRDGFRDCAIEIGLMPADAYPREEFARDRVSTVLQFRICEESRGTLYLPGCYGEALGYLLAEMEMDRTVRECHRAGAGPTVLHPEHFDFARVSRAHVRSEGADFEPVAAAFESDALAQGARVVQFYLNLADPGVGSAVERLRSRGYFFGGLLPHWFESDGLLMQKVLDLPDFRSIRLYTDRARRILDFVRNDLETGIPKEQRA